MISMFFQPLTLLTCQCDLSTTRKQLNLHLRIENLKTGRGQVLTISGGSTYLAILRSWGHSAISLDWGRIKIWGGWGYFAISPNWWYLAISNDWGYSTISQWGHLGILVGLGHLELSRRWGRFTILGCWGYLAISNDYGHLTISVSCGYSEISQSEESLTTVWSEGTLEFHGAGGT